MILKRKTNILKVAFPTSADSQLHKPLLTRWSQNSMVINILVRYWERKGKKQDSLNILWAILFPVDIVLTIPQEATNNGAQDDRG